MKKTKTNKLPTQKNNIVIEDDLIIEFIGEFLHSDHLTIEQLNEGYNINYASKVVKVMLFKDIIEEVQGSNPKEY